MVATVNGKAITARDLERQVKVYLTVRPGSQVDRATRRLVLDQLVRQELLAQAARRGGLDQDPAFRQALERRRQELRAELEQSIASAKVQLESLDEAVETKALIDALQRREGRGLAVGEDELARAYQARRAASAGAPPSLRELEPQLREQLQLEKLVAKAREKADLRIHEEAIP